MNKGFFASLLDLSFTSFVTPKLIKILFIISLVILAFAYVVIAISIFFAGGGTEFDSSSGTFEDSGGNAAFGVLWLLILGPLFLFFYTLLYRVLFELIIVLFRIFENSRDLVALTRAANPAASAAVPESSSLGGPAAGSTTGEAEPPPAGPQA